MIARRKSWLMAALLLMAMPLAAGAATITIINNDGFDEGFNLSTPVPPIGGNPGTTIGAQRLYVFQYAANIWGSILPSAVTIQVLATFDPIVSNPPCSAASGVLGSTSTLSFFANFAGAPLANMAYNQALANKLSGVDQNVASEDMIIIFNSDVDNAICLGSTSWYYGVDGKEGTDVELLPVVLHEMAHGLGFTAQVNSSGAYSTGIMLPSIYSHFLLDNSTGLHWDAMSNAQRATSFINTGNVVWDGPAMNAQTPVYLQHQRLLTVVVPAVIAGDYRAGTATFGADITNPVVTAPVVLANDGVADLSTSNGCTPLVNAVAGKIALIDRGGCTFVSKAQAAQNAGAVGAIIADTISTPITLDLGGTEPALTIPVLGISRADGLLIKAQLAGGVTATIGGTHPVWLAGADLNGRARIYAPNPVESGSSISHFDRSALPNLLMEPAITASLTSQVDLTRHAFRDLGWFTGSTITGVPEGDGPELRLSSAPNPFDGATTVSFRLARTGSVKLDVFGVDGRHVRQLANGSLPAGAHAMVWNGRDDTGRPSPAGVYLVRLHSVEGEWTGRVVRLR